MRRYALTEFGGDLEVIDGPEPMPRGREVLLRVRRCGVCHSDVHIKHGYFDLGDGEQFRMADRGMTLPMAMGHEVLGEVVASGPEAGDIPIGETRLVHPWIGCGSCEACHDERDNDCTAMNALGIVRDGGYASHIVVPDPRFLVDVEGIDPAVAAPLACSGLTVYSALKKALPLRGGEWLAVFGAGGLGLSAVSIAQAMGVANIVAIDLDDAKLAAATAQGATAVFNPKGVADGPATLRDIAGGNLLAAVDTVGAEATAHLAALALKKTGRLVIVGLHGGRFSIPLPFFPQRALTVRGSYVGSVQELRELVTLARAGQMKPIPVATRAMEEADQTLKDLEAGKIVGRVVLSTE